MSQLPALTVTMSGLRRIFGDDLWAVVDWCVAAEAAGVSQVVLPDHVVMGDHLDDYPFGTFPYPPDEPWLEPMVTLAAVAGATTNLRLGTGILVAPARPAPLLAKQAATLAVLSKGRFDLGVAEGWQAIELAANRADPRRRAETLDEQIVACRALWSEPGTSITLDGTEYGPLWCEPRPPGGTVPLWFGGGPTARTARRIGTWGVGWLPVAGTPDDQLALGVARIGAAFEACGRDPGSLQVRAGLAAATTDAGALDATATRAAAAKMATDGITAVSVTLGRQVTSVAEATELVGVLGEAWQP